MGRSTSGFGVRDKFQFTASGSETSISGSDDNGRTLKFADGKYLDVYLNGVLLVDNTDYKTTTTNTISNLTALAANDFMEMVSYDIFSVADTVPATGGTFSGNITAASNLSVTGDLTVTGNIIGDIEITGTTPKLTIGDADAEDSTLQFDGNAQDYYIALDDSADDLLIGLGSTVGTTPAIAIDENLLVTTHGGITMAGTTPTLTIGDAGAEDTKIVFDGNAKDFYIALDDSADKIVIGEGSTVGTNSILTITDDAVTIGDAAAVDTKIVFDGNAQDYYIALDDSADDLLIGLGSTVGTTPAISIDENLAVKTYGDITMTGTTPTLTIGDAGAEDSTLQFDGNAQDFYIALDDSADDLLIGLGSTVGTTPALAIDENLLATFHGGITMAGTTPTLTIGDAGAEDTKIVFDGNAKDFYIGLDDSADKLVIGEGSTVGTNSILTITDDAVTIGDAAAVDSKLVFDGNAQDYYIALDDSADDLLIGLGSTVGTTAAIAIDENLQITTGGDIVMGGATPTLTIGDAGAEDAKIVFDGNAQDFYIGLDDSADDLVIGKGSALGTTPAISVDENLKTQFGGGAVGKTSTANATGNTTLDYDANSNFVLTATGNVTLVNPTTETVGQTGIIVFIQDGTGSRTLSTGTQYEWPAGTAGTISTAANSVDVIPYVVDAADSILLGAPQLAFATPS